MSLSDDVRKLSEEAQSRKLVKLKKYEKEIRRMIADGVPLTKQIDLLLKHGIVEKLYYAEYYKIAQKHFGYTGRRTQKVFKAANPKKEHRPQKTPTANDPVAQLSKDVDLLDFYNE